MHTVQIDENFLRVGYYSPKGYFVTIEAFDRSDETEVLKAYRLVNYLNGGEAM